MSVTKEQVLQALARVMSPGNVPLVDAGVLSDVVVNDGKIMLSINVDAGDVREWEKVRAQADAAVRALPGVSSATASRVLTGSARVKPQTRRRVEQAMSSLGYVRNRAPRSTDSRRAGSITSSC